MPPRSPSVRPQARPKPSHGRMPAEKTMMSVDCEVPSAKCISRPPAPASIRWVALLVRTATPSASTCCFRCLLPSSSSCTPMSPGANSTTEVCRPRFCNALAHSKPNKPPPTTTPRDLSWAAVLIASRSSNVRYTKHSGRSLPSIGGTNGYEPVAKTRVS